MDKIIPLAIGADIELFLQHKQTKEIVSAEGFILGTKENPFVFDKKNQYFATSLDNVLAEFCIPPAKTKAEFYNNIRKSIGYINKTIPNDLCTVALPSANLDIKYLQTEQAKIFGCEPDFNAYTGFQNNRPFCEDLTLRSAGGHLHFSYENAEQYDKDNYVGDEQRCDIIKAFDLHIGVPSVILEPDNKRKELYGKAGCFRPKSYGVEYRTISNFYLASKKLTLWAYDAMQNAIKWLNEGYVIEDGLANVIRNTINNNDKQMANELIKDFNLTMA